MLNMTIELTGVYDVDVLRLEDAIARLISVVDVLSAKVDELSDDVENMRYLGSYDRIEEE